ncbi:polysaccharide biosynthesis tyrosine autokinase [Rhodoplanes sp. TEM]|uniref:Polysaccharide biosynthesis tyrosine autokinase n=1 Tax=Rhodoplanes tepidamans TaxID=200616 RepID=A0ABT5JBZ6_RHOTP|nr:MULTISPECIES: polysaccharide biosynthesis tyrosine autokinase [Rhodoplanes]MDC7787137.1 polysaccharide biosynthesis tyrosine autokinase [Rhodoplanes tepidamans]MDC7984299.1 polysaccharide biosynthesis tyrosine autokinase [Rhodoplanes sp. TEM]MDQ0356096.1 capsular exopolysaccharide synthesis family protein [Rhodoplanes tepidamans]
MSMGSLATVTDLAGTPRRNGLLVRLWRRRWIAGSVFLAVMVVTVAALLVLPVSYLANGSVIVAEPEPGVPNQSAAWAQKIGDPADLESQLLVVRSPRVMRLAMAMPGAHDAVLRECRWQAGRGLLGLLFPSREDACDKLAPDSEELIEYVMARYKVGTVGRSRVINIAYQSPLPDVAQTLANALVTAFLDDQKANLSSSREAAAAYLWQELKQLDAEVRENDAAIQEFRRAKGLMRGAAAPISSERLTSINQQLATAEAARAEAAARLREIKASQARGAADAPSVLSSRSVADLKQQLTTVTGQLANMAFTLGERHPSLRALQRERDILEQRLGQEVATVAASAQKSYDAADALVASLKQQAVAIKAEVAAATADEASIESMVRSADIKRQKYSELYRRASELETERRVMLGSTRLVSLAEAPTRPFFPKKLPFLAAGFTFATLLGFAAALLRDRADRSVRASGDLASVTGAPIFAELPRVARAAATPVLGMMLSRQSELPLPAALDKARRDPHLQDALRKLYAGIVLAGSNERFRTILVTSSGPAEGKTFTTLALAQLVAATGRRVLVMECDMRRPTIATALDLTGGPGMTAVLSGKFPLREAVVRSGIPNLDVIPAGRPTSTSTELLMSKTMVEALRFAEAYDLVLIDSPPADVLMDAHVLAKHVDGVLCCTRWGRSSIAGAAATIESLRAAGGNVFGMTITMVKPDDLPFYEARPVRPVAYLGAA